MKSENAVRGLAVAGTLALTLLAAGAQAAPPGVEPRADEVMREMGRFLAGLPRFAFEAEETFDDKGAQGPRVQLGNVRRLAVERPARFAADAIGDTLNRASWYDGQTLTALDKDVNMYLAVEVPGTIDAVLDKIAREYDVVMPLADLAYSDAYAALMESVVSGAYLGLHQVAGIPCHHLAFSQENTDWQIWIDAGDQPLPRKLVISSATEAGAPQYSVVIRRWELDPAFPAGLFRFEAPEGATGISLPAPRQRPAPAPAEPRKDDRAETD
jgi:hypothetical protein